MKKFTIYLSLLLTTLPGHSVLALEPSLEELRQRCDAAREEKIAPLREQAVAECMERQNRPGSRSKIDCERFYADFGEAQGIVGGGTRPRMFNDLPECIELYGAETGERRR